MSGRRAITLVAAARDPRAAAQQGVPRLDAHHARCSSAARPRFSGALSQETTYHVAVTAPAPRRPRRRARSARRCRSTTRRCGCGWSVAGRRTARRSRPSTSTRFCSSAQDRLVFRADVDAKAAAIADTAVRALRRHLPPAPELTTATLEPPDTETHGRRGARRLRGLAAPAPVARDLRPVGGQRRRRGEEQPRRRDDPVDGAAAPPARRQGDRDRAARLRPARPRRRPRGRAPRRRRLRRAGRARRQRRARHPVVRARVRALRGRLRRRGRARLAASRTPTRPASPSRTRSSPSTSPATSPSQATRTACWRTCSRSSRSPRRSCSPPAARSSACRSGSTSLAVVLVLATIYALVRVAGRVYGQGLLRSGPRLGVRAALRLTHHS